ncbi:MAG: hypothetical protein K1W36_11125 [Lachnospiraceae bacterium]|nr:hypothetical protein [Lachnospiraceae bacterium]
MKKYTNSVLALFICMLILTPSTVYAEELVNMPAFSIIQPITGAALANENLTDSLTARLNLYLVDNYTNGNIDEQKFNEIVASGMISENAFFANSVFVGDSLTVGFKEYCRTHESIASDSTYFLARVSCSAKAAISKNALTEHAGIMPIYNGQVQYIEDSISQLPNVSKIFICYGMNDLTGSTPSQFVSDMQTLIARITAKTPGLQVYVISIPCITSGVSTGYLSNESIQTANVLLQDVCMQNGWGFINISEHLMGPDNAICPEYSSDSYVHENSRAYKIWNNVLKDYAFMEITK